MAILVTRLATAVSSRKTPKLAINRNFPGLTCIFSKCCERQKRSARNSTSGGQKYRAFWSPEIRVMAILVTRLATAVSSRKTHKMAINRNFPGLTCIFSMLREAETKSKKFRIRWSKVPRFLEPLKSGCGLFSHPAGHGHFKPKNTQNGNKSRFPGATCIFSKCCVRQKRRARNSASDGQKYRAFWSP